MSREEGCLQVEPAGAEDVDAILAIEQVCFPSTWSWQQFFHDVVHNPATYYLVARWGGRVVGHAGMYVSRDEAHVTTIAVLPEYRRRGIGMRLMLGLIEEARQRGATRMTLEVRVSNHGAQALYERLGFYSVALRRGYYTDNGEDALVMWIPNLRAPWLEALWREEEQRAREKQRCGGSGPHG